MAKMTSERIVNASHPDPEPLPPEELAVLREAVAAEGGKNVIYRDQDGQLFFIDQDFDVLFVDLDGGGLPPDEVRQLPGSYCDKRGNSTGDIVHDFIKAKPIKESWKNILKRSHGL